jgi:peptidyl-prolyl cis-trans isomerase C
VYGVAAALLVTLAACGRDGGRGEYVARVNGAVLTNADIVHQRDSLGEPGAASREYINEWVVNELLYQEAERQGVTDGPAFREQLDLTRKRLAVAALLGNQVYARVDTSSISEDSIAAVFARSGTDYALREDATQASLVVFRDRETANAFRATILRGAAWDASLASIQSKGMGASPIVRSANRQFFTRSTLFPEELWKLARSLSREDVSFPLRTDEGHVVLRTHQNYRQGEIPPFAYARAEVCERLLMTLRRQRFEEFVGSLRKRYTIDIRESPAGHDTSAIKE